MGWLTPADNQVSVILCPHPLYSLLAAVYWVLGCRYLEGALLNGVSLPTIPFEPRDAPHMVLPRRPAHQPAAARQLEGSTASGCPVGPPRTGIPPLQPVWGPPVSSASSAAHGLRDDSLAWGGGQGTPGHPHPIESSRYFMDQRQDFSSAASMVAETGSSRGVAAATNYRDRHVSGASTLTNNSSLSSASSRELVGEMLGRMRRGLSAAASRLFRRGGGGGTGRNPPQ